MLDCIEFEHNLSKSLYPFVKIFLRDRQEKAPKYHYQLWRYNCEVLELCVTLYNSFPGVGVHWYTGKALIHSVGVFRKKELVIFVGRRTQSYVHYLRMRDEPFRIVWVYTCGEVMYPIILNVHLQLQHAPNIVKPHVDWFLETLFLHIS